MKRDQQTKIIPFSYGVLAGIATLLLGISFSLFGFDLLSLSLPSLFLGVLLEESLKLLFLWKLFSRSMPLHFPQREEYGIVFALGFIFVEILLILSASPQVPALSLIFPPAIIHILTTLLWLYTLLMYAKRHLILTFLFAFLAILLHFGYNFFLL